MLEGVIGVGIGMDEFIVLYRQIYSVISMEVRYNFLEHPKGSLLPTTMNTKCARKMRRQERATMVNKKNLKSITKAASSLYFIGFARCQNCVGKREFILLGWV